MFFQKNEEDMKAISQRSSIKDEYLIFNILSLAKSGQQENNTVLVCSIVPRNDHLVKKGKGVNII